MLVVTTMACGNGQPGKSGVGAHGLLIAAIDIQFISDGNLCSSSSAATSPSQQLCSMATSDQAGMACEAWHLTSFGSGFNKYLLVRVAHVAAYCLNIPPIADKTVAAYHAASSPAAVASYTAATHGGVSPGALAIGAAHLPPAAAAVAAGSSHKTPPHGSWK